MIDGNGADHIAGLYRNIFEKVVGRAMKDTQIVAGYQQLVDVNNKD